MNRASEKGVIKMRMGIDQPGKERHLAQISGRPTPARLDSLRGTNRRDDLALDHHGAVLQHFALNRNYQASTENHGRLTTFRASATSRLQASWQRSGHSREAS